MKKVLYVLLPQFAEHELPYLTQPLRSDSMAMKENPKYENKIVAESMEPIEAISGFRVLPDYTFDSIPEDYAALWRGRGAAPLASPLTPSPCSATGARGHLRSESSCACAGSWG